MLKRKTGIIMLVLCVFFQLMLLGAQAASTLDAVEPINTENKCSREISYCYGDTAFSGAEVKLYKIADVSADFQYTLTEPFEISGIILNGIRTSGEWDVVRSTLEVHILVNGIKPDAVFKTDQNGVVSFDELSTGMYFATVDQITQNDQSFRFDSAVVALPGLGSDGRWQYDVTVNAKPEALPPVDPDTETTLKVVKLWKGEENKSTRPESIEIQIFKNGESFETVILSEENNWSYSWTVKQSNSVWNVTEKNVPQGYTMTVEVRESSFVVTNTYTTSDNPPDLPQTGDTSNIMLYVILMLISGMVLVALGSARKRITNEENE